MSHRQSLGWFVLIAVVGWIGYLLVFQHFFPDDYDPASSRATFWLWLAGGTTGVLGVLFATFRLLRTPPEWKPSMAIAGVAPALCLDAIATTFYTDWFTAAGPHEPVAYSATVLGGAGAMLLVALALGARNPR